MSRFDPGATVWKIYAVLLCLGYGVIAPIREGVLLLVAYRQSTPLAPGQGTVIVFTLVGDAVGVVCLAGLVGLGFEFRVGKQWFWQVWAYLSVGGYLATRAYFLRHAWLLARVGRSHFLVSGVIESIVLAPSVLGIFVYAYRRPQLWQAGAGLGKPATTGAAPARPSLVCPECGHPYDLADYRADVAVIR